ncbi:LCP family protein [Micromonospora narathiwatensis]|uniref:Transcriptional attenuator, LytR family n=1 Tax=Micromonospora narathiwatensis TaxID=299146 RepID=A0A1A9AB19_9ACTN|nr:LCP family protein [Micromonospora narathiwatensis]SBT53684.1 transcriptional attenuator, LytR family [Micromonospora narathiwatensis]
MIENDLRAAFARLEALTPPIGPVRVAIERAAVRRRRRRFRLRLGGTALLLVAAATAGFTAFVPHQPAPATLLGEPAPPTPTGALNVLLLGVDSTSTQRPPLADSVLLVHLPADRSRPYLVSLPRDLEVAIPGLHRDKLNAAFAYGAGYDPPDQSKGYDLTRRAVVDLIGVPVDAGAVLTYPVLRKVTDALGGVEVCLPQQIRSSHTRRAYPAGCQRLDGSASVDLLRQRRGLPDGGLDRDRNAQRFAAGLVRRARAKDVLGDPVQLSRIVAAVGPDLTVAGGSVLDLLRVVPELTSVEPVGLSLPVELTEGSNGRLHADPRAAPAFLAALREDRLAEWAAAHPDRVTPIR